MTADTIGELIDQFGTEIYRFCMKCCGSKEDGEDLYQQTFLRMLEIDSKVEWDQNPRAFLYSIASSIWRNKIRKDARHKRIAPSMAIEADTENLLVASENIEKEFLTKEQNKEVRGVIDALPEKYKLPIILYYQSELPIEEIGLVMKIPLGTVKSRLFKGRNLVKKRLEGLGYVK